MSTIKMDPRREMDLVNRIVEAALGQSQPSIKKLVGHTFPDTDVWACLWAAKKFIEKAQEAEIVFVRAGESLETDDDESVLHFDTGGGEYDNHNDENDKRSSFALFVDKMGWLTKWPGLTSLVELTNTVDNIGVLPATSIHYIIEGLPRKKEYKTERGPDWEKIQERVFELFDIVFNQEEQRIRSRAEFRRSAEIRLLPNGLRVASLFWKLNLREAAFETGIDVMVGTEARGAGKFYVVIQRNRKLNGKLGLDVVAATLRSREASIRRIPINGKNLRIKNTIEGIPGWFLHKSFGLILCGSKAFPLTKEEFTKQDPRGIADATCRALSSIPKAMVDGWRKK
ncbi:MAG: chromate resistance protein [Candidatus Pacebacteria bacterium]|nr:chromate resistance protein [Candidatus Paceibacterota bacterium]